MTYVVKSNRFTINQMEAGTDPDAWIQALSITTWKGCAQSQVGGDTVLLTVIYE